AVTQEEERFLAMDRATEGAAKLVALEFGLRGCKEVFRIQIIVAMELKSRAVKAIAAAFRADDHLPACLTSVFSRVGSREYLKLAYAIQHGGVIRLISGLVQVINAIEQEVVCDFTVSRHIEAAAEPERGTLRRQKHIGLQLRKRKKAAQVQRQTGNFMG